MADQKTAGHDSDVQSALAADLLTGWAPDSPLDTTQYDLAPYAAKRRAALSSALSGQALVVPAGVPKVRAGT
jgi:Xaa-Pro aminopeptidase